MILGLRPANERRRYNVTPSLIGWRKPKISPEVPLTRWHMGDVEEVLSMQYLEHIFTTDI